MGSQTSLRKYQILYASPLVCVFIGVILTVAGNIASSEICKVAGPVVMTIGGLLLVGIPACCPKQHHLKGGENSDGTLNSLELHSVPISDKIFTRQEEPIHQVEVRILPVGLELVPPSYEEAVSSNGTEVSIAVDSQDEQAVDMNETSGSEPPSYEESHGERLATA